jgi:hypothetical protein
MGFRAHIECNSPKIQETPVCYLLHTGFLLAYCSDLKMETTCSSETSLGFQWTTQSYILEDRTLHNHRCEKLKSYIAKYISERKYLEQTLWREEKQFISNTSFPYVTLSVNASTLYSALKNDLTTPQNYQIKISFSQHCRSQWSRGLRPALSSIARTLGSWVRIPLKAWMFVCASILCLCCPVCR